MILNVSERTDIVAFYFPWFLNRMKEGYAYVRNPYYPQQVSRVLLTKENIEVMIFTTKDPRPLEYSLSKILAFQIAFGVSVTITPYRKEIEPFVPEKWEIIASFQRLSEKIGKEKMIVRYDPIFLNDQYTICYHLRSMESLFSKLEGYTNTCILSFLDLYSFLDSSFRTMTKKEIVLLIKEASKIAKKYKITLQTCAEEIDLSSYGVQKRGCIDQQYLEIITGKRIQKPTKRTTRKACLCLETIDLGVYNTCPHGCRYCYASSRKKEIAKNIQKHDPHSPFLIGSVEDGDQITERKKKLIFASSEQFTISFE